LESGKQKRMLTSTGRKKKDDKETPRAPSQGHEGEKASSALPKKPLLRRGRKKKRERILADGKRGGVKTTYGGA